MSENLEKSICYNASSGGEITGQRCLTMWRMKMENVQQIAAGDKVVWRGKSSKLKDGRRVMPIGVANCKVIMIDTASYDEPVAMIQMPRVMWSDECPDGKVAALVSDLEKMDGD
jgi:hypothetical protein